MGRQKSKGCAYRIGISTNYGGKSREEILDELIDKIIEIEKLKKKLRNYENPHTPPSKDERKSRANFVSITGLAVGKRTGYKGATRKQKEPNDFLNCFDGICLQCGKHNKPTKVKSKIYEEIPEPQPIKVVKQQVSGYFMRILFANFNAYFS